MDTTFNAKCNPAFDGAWSSNSSQRGFLQWLSRLADRFPYPEIRSGDYRMAEYVPQDWQSNRT